CTLTAGSFDLKKHTVVVEAKDAKNDRRAVLPLRATTVEQLQEHLRDKHPSAAAFATPHKDTFTKLYKQDVEAAGIRWENDAHEFADFHALRHTFITNLANSGVHPKVAMDLARHSDIRLTMSYYTHMALEKLSEAVQMLPEIAVEAAAVKT